jgi:hypothetical protein
MRAFLTAAAMSLLSLPALAAAGDNLLFTGGEVSGHHNNYGQVGMIVPLPGSTLGNGWATRGVVDGLTYKYDESGANIDADAIGGQLTVGYQSSGEPGWWALYSGPSYRYTDLSPKDPANRARGSDFSWIVLAEGERKLTQDFKVNLSGNYLISGNDAFWTRARLLYRVSGEMFFGPEGVWQGDNQYHAWQIGAGLFGIPLDQNTMLGVKGGMRKSDHFTASPYGGLEVGYKF